MIKWLTRRRFLGSAVGAAACSMSVSRCFGKTSAAVRFPIGIQSYSLRGFTLDEAIAHASELGFAHIEFYPGHLSQQPAPAAVEAVKRNMEQANMRMLGHGVHHFTVDDEANRRVFEFAKVAGIRCLTADPDPDSFDSLNRLVKEFDIRVSIHNHGPTHRYNKAVDVCAAYEPHDHRIGACADLGHYIKVW